MFLIHKSFATLSPAMVCTIESRSTIASYVLRAQAGAGNFSDLLPCYYSVPS